MPGTILIRSLLLCAFVLGASALGDSSFESWESEKQEPVSLASYVNCEHARRMLELDSTQFELGALLRRCWYNGVTPEDIGQGVLQAEDREDQENFGFDEFYLSCEEVFGSGLAKLTTSLAQDFVQCENASAMNMQTHSRVYARFGDILDVIKLGNASMSIDEETLVPCQNRSKSVLDVCSKYGLTRDQLDQGFVRYYHDDKWIVEEDVTSLYLTCDRVFQERLEKIAYDNYMAAFVQCLDSTTMDPRVRDAFEKENAVELQAYREQYTPDRPFVDLRGYVSCRNLLPVRINNTLVSPTLRGVERCRSEGLRYKDLVVGDHAGSELVRDSSLKLDELYIDCSLVFDENLYSFSTDLLKDFEACKKADKVPTEARKALHKKFAHLFELLTNKSKRVPLTPNVLEHLVRCSNVTGRLENLCRERGSTTAQELRGIGSFSRALGNHWLNTEDLDKLYVRCDDVFADLAAYQAELEQLPIEQYMQCRWTEQLADEGKQFIDKRIGSVYENKHRWNGTRYIGDADVEISSLILFDDD